MSVYYVCTRLNKKIQKILLKNDNKPKRGSFLAIFCSGLLLQWNLDLRKPNLRKNLDLRKIVAATDFLVHKLFDLRKTF